MERHRRRSSFDSEICGRKRRFYGFESSNGIPDMRSYVKLVNWTHNDGSIFDRAQEVCRSASKARTPAAADVAAYFDSLDTSSTKSLGVWDIIEHTECALNCLLPLLGLENRAEMQTRSCDDYKESGEVGFRIPTANGGDALFEGKVVAGAFFVFLSDFHQVIKQGQFDNNTRLRDALKEQLFKMISMGVPFGFVSTFKQTVLIDLRRCEDGGFEAVLHAVESKDKPAFLRYMYAMCKELLDGKHSTSTAPERVFLADGELPAGAADAMLACHGSERLTSSVCAVCGGVDSQRHSDASRDAGATIGTGDALKLLEVASLDALPENVVCLPPGDEQYCPPGTRVFDIIKGRRIGCGSLAYVYEAVFRGEPVAIKRIVLGKQSNNISLYDYETNAYRALHSLWGDAVATPLLSGMDNHDSVSLVIECGRLSPDWCERDLNLALAALGKIHMAGFLHGAARAWNVVFTHEGVSRRAFWIDLKSVRASDDQEKQLVELQRLCYSWGRAKDGEKDDDDWQLDAAV
nr:hypothetical protein HK105_006719 [Polyrhizophydium stewartii]